MKEIDDLIAAYLQEQATSQEVEYLFKWVREDPANAREFARATILHSQLREQISGLQQVHESGQLPTVVRQARSGNEGQPLSVQPLPRQLLVRKVLVTFSLCLLALAAYVHRQGGKDEQDVVRVPVSPQKFVTIEQTIDAVCSGAKQIQTGDRMAESTFNLESGFVRMRIDSGVEVTLEGPAEFELISAEHAIFRKGLLTSTVPPGAEGFRVDTPRVEVVDLGTAFGIDLSEEGAAKVSVFEGEVEVELAGSGRKQLLTEGKAILVGSDLDMESIPFDASAYEKIWPVSSGIMRSSGAFRFAPPWPRRLRNVRSDRNIFVIPERYAVTLDSALKVNVSHPGKYKQEDQLTPQQIPVGQSVRSFVLHYQPEEVRRPRRAGRISGSIVFNRRVLGLIVLHDELQSSAGRFSPRHVGESHVRRQIELKGGPAGDEVTLSPDGHTVTVDLASPNFSSDLVRVIVDASSAKEPHRKQE